MGLCNDRREFCSDEVIKSFDTDMFEELTVAGALKFFQEVSANHLSCFGLSYNELKLDGRVFLLTSLVLRINEPPLLRQKVRVTTWHRGSKGAQFMRDTVICGEDGSALVECAARWVLVDPEEHRILRPTGYEKLASVPAFCERELLDGRTASVKCPEDMEKIGERVVRFSDIDYNRHLNNTKYADIICDCLEEELLSQRIYELELIYSGEATLSEHIELYRKNCEDQSILIKGTHKEGRCFEARVRLCDRKPHKKFF